MERFIEILTRQGGLLEGYSQELVTILQIIFLVAIAVFILAFLSLYAGITSVAERKIAGRMQSRLGPNKVWFRGLFQFLADGLKIIQKEDIIPDLADKPLFRIAPYIVVMAMFSTWVAIPFGAKLIPADINIGIIYIMAVASLNVIGILMAGWASNNKWSLIGGIRAAAQIVSYEIPSALAALTAVILAGSLSMQDIISKQGAWPWQWHITHDPFTMISFFIMLISLLAEGNRTPFDIPEAESELVSGYNTEYSGFRFLLFFLAEWANIYIISAVVTTLYLGGWQTPWTWEPLIPIINMRFELIGVLFFLTKSVIITFIVIWIRWSLPRLRVDQLMTVCWKYFIPISFFNLFGLLFWIVLFPENLASAASLTISLGFVLVSMIFLYYVIVKNFIQMNAKVGF